MPAFLSHLFCFCCHGYNTSLTSRLPFPHWQFQPCFQDAQDIWKSFQYSTQSNDQYLSWHLWECVRFSALSNSSECHLWFPKLLNDGSSVKSQCFLQTTKHADSQLRTLVKQHGLMGWLHTSCYSFGKRFGIQFFVLFYFVFLSYFHRNIFRSMTPNSQASV